MSPVLTFVLTFVVLLAVLRKLVTTGRGRPASTSLFARVPRAVVKLVCWFFLVNTSAISAYGIASSPDGDMGYTLKMVAGLLLLICPVPVLILRRLRSADHATDPSPAPATARGRKGPQGGRSLRERLVDFTSMPTDRDA